MNLLPIVAEKELRDFRDMICIRNCGGDANNTACLVTMLSFNFSTKVKRRIMIKLTIFFFHRNVARGAAGKAQTASNSATTAPTTSASTGPQMTTKTTEKESTSSSAWPVPSA